MTYPLHFIASNIGATVSGDTTSREVGILLTDSRSLTYPDISLFFALHSPSNDGHRYIPALYREGVRSFVVEQVPHDASSLYPEATFLCVPDTLAALQTIAACHRRRFSIPVVGITGSRGKTTVKEWLYQLLRDDYHIVRSPRSYNSQIGVPLSLWEMNEYTTLSVFEAGISKPGEMPRLRNMICPEIVMITNIGSEHSQGFRDMAAKIDEKLTLSEGAKCVIYSADDERIASRLASRKERGLIHGSLLGWSCSDTSAPLLITDIIPTDTAATTSSSISYRYRSPLNRAETQGRITIPFTRDSEVQNSLHCLALLLYLGYTPEVIAERFATLTPADTRMAVLEGVNNCVVFYDGYTSDLHSLAPAIEFMQRRCTADQTQTLILSDLMHETLEPDARYRSLSRLIASKRINRFIGIGPELCAYSHYFSEGDLKGKCRFFTSSAEFLRNMRPSDFDHEHILIKGAPQYHFERITQMLEARKHETVLEVNLESLVHNFNFYRSLLRPTTGIVCMLKASGYGAGSYELAKTLQSQGAAYLAVAAIDEGVDLRMAGITMPIMVLNPKSEDYHTLFSYRLEPEIYSFEMLEDIIRAARSEGIKDYPLHIKIDTGMHRLGFLEEDIPELCRVLKSQDAVKPVSVFSHLATADEPTMDDYTLMQLDTFDRVSNALQQPFDHHIKRHILNSTGITRFTDRQYDMVRLGICLYGIPTMNDGSQKSLQPVSSLYSVVISIKEWGEGTTIGYGRKGKVTRPSRIATIPIGYADGINRHLGNGNMKVWINGTLCPTIGNICMDACMIDVSGAECEPGDRVEIFGPHIPVSQLAESLGTISYEILTSISSRVKRVYFG